ncbi:MAG: hypothetical protein HND53_07815 [Proteobacteria bacterium]|nr:hypothetical protein [Pseudomonadota bacterium]NOG60388.1 hypothetical protein [Pseudomonadota bacterium]
MNVNQIKTKIFILKAIDVILVTSFLVTCLYTALYAENKGFMIFCCFVGLFLVNAIGNMTSKKVAILHVQLEMLERDLKREKQRTLLNTRHTVNRTKTTGATKTNNTTGK